jgi:hypothetical protein
LYLGVIGDLFVGDPQIPNMPDAAVGGSADIINAVLGTYVSKYSE